MRKTIVAACIVAASLLGSTATAAADTCTATAWWQLTAEDTLTLSVGRDTATGTGCAEMLPPVGAEYTLLGVYTVGLPYFNVALAERTDGLERGEVHIWESGFFGNFMGTTEAGDSVRTSYTPLRRCAPRCWVTTGTWTRD
ncbi:MAG TPA: hypothetical protein VHF89_20370 [Solirubrobacteraceae bacterium]|nr:hypothetical protein [Solirubrobacteraceae bacterium]